MGKFNNENLNTPRFSEPNAITFEGGDGYTRDTKTELFLLAVCNFVGESTFYEKAAERDKRYNDLISSVVKTDPDWVKDLVPYLRNSLNMRSASLVLAAEYVRAGGPNGRSVVSSACARADEPAEMLAYWLGTYGRKIPAAVKRGVADACVRLYTERNVLRYDGSNNTIRFADTIELCHPVPKTPLQSELFKYLLDDRHHPDTAEIPESLTAIEARAIMQMMTPLERHQFMRKVQNGDEEAKKMFELGLAGKWEWFLSFMGEGTKKEEN